MSMKKRILCTLGAALIMATSIPNAFAANLPPVPTSCGESEIVPYADVIIYRYRIANGRKQYRRWNETRGYWVDPYWLDVPGGN